MSEEIPWRDDESLDHVDHYLNHRQVDYTSLRRVSIGQSILLEEKEAELQRLRNEVEEWRKLKRRVVDCFPKGHEPSPFDIAALITGLNLIEGCTKPDLMQWISVDENPEVPADGVYFAEIQRDRFHGHYTVLWSVVVVESRSWVLDVNDKVLRYQAVPTSTPIPHLPEKD